MKLFVYGTLRDKNVQRKVFGRILEAHPSLLYGYARSYFISEGKRYSRIYRTKGRSVRGLVLNVTRRDIDNADAYEAGEYTRITATLRNGEEAYVYVGRRRA